MTRAEDMEAGGYAPGGGYRPEGLTARGFALVLLALAAYGGLLWLLARLFGESREHDIVQIGCWLLLGWVSVREIRTPLRRDPYASDGERRRARNWACVLLVAAIACIAFSALHLVLRGGHGG